MTNYFTLLTEVASRAASAHPSVSSVRIFSCRRLASERLSMLDRTTNAAISSIARGPSRRKKVSRRRAASNDPRVPCPTPSVPATKLRCAGRVPSTVIDEENIMTRYQAATSTMSAWLAKARRPNEHGPGAHEVRGFVPISPRVVASLENPSMVVRLWRTAARWAAAAISALVRAVS
jgi:hypothetical protein